MRGIFAIVSIVSLVLSAQLLAEKASEPPATDNSQRPAASGDARRDASSADRQTVRASEIIGTSVNNKNDEELGSIHDLVIDPVDGSVVYAAVSMGGFLGVGDKLFAVPWAAIECRKVDDKYVAVLDVDKRSLENARGFDETDWPDMARQEWRTDNDRPYKLRRARTRDAVRPVRQQ
jgi:sporulation protein YlmC with PRC-barrel domain